VNECAGDDIALKAEPACGETDITAHGVGRTHLVVDARPPDRALV
jgi:hypothetical protein